MNVIPMTYNNYKFDELTITFDNDDEKQLLNNALNNDKDAELNDVANDIFNALRNDNTTTIIDVLNSVRKTNLIYGKKYDYKINEFELRKNDNKYELTINVTVMTKDKHEKLYDLSITFDDNDLKQISDNDE
jgi:allophanate hydrolase subunit 1